MQCTLMPISRASPAKLEQAAMVLLETMGGRPSVWPDIDSARTEVRSFLNGHRTAVLAVEEDSGVVVGWAGVIRHSSVMWELHPVVVMPDARGAGIGRALVERLEDAARDAGVCTIWLGTDDDQGATSLSGVDLYPNVLDHLRSMHTISTHACDFYQRLGYTVVGVIPDASGPGQPDILMAKRIVERADDDSGGR